MASKFIIHVDHPKTPGSSLRVRVEDCSMEEFTPWTRVPSALREQDDKVLAAVAWKQSQTIRNMLDVASKIAYSVYLNEYDLDIFSFLDRADGMAGQALADIEHDRMEKRTKPANGNPGRLRSRL